MAQDQVYADLLEALSPLTAAGIDPDEARMDRAGTMAKLMPSDNAEPSWADNAKADYEDQQQQATTTPPDDGTAAPAPQLSPNGNPLPPGLNSRQAPPAPAVPAAVTPTGDATAPSLADRNSKSIGIMETNLQRASQDVQNEAAQPDLATQTRVLEQQRANAQARQVADQNPYDPKTGKMRAEYKPSFGQRLVRGVEGFAGGGVLGLLDPQVGGAKAYGAPNKEFAIDQQQDAGRVAGADQQLANAAANYKATSDRLAKIAADRRAVATTGKDVTGASIAQQDIPIKQEQADTAAAPKNEMEAISAYGRETDPAKKSALWNTVQKMHEAVMQEKPPHEGPIPSAESQEFNAWTRAFPKTHGGKQPTAEDIEAYGRRSGKIDPDADAEVGSIVAQAMDAKQKYAENWTDNHDGTLSDSAGHTIPLAEFTAQINKLGRSDPNVKLAKKGYTIDETGQMVKLGGQPPKSRTLPPRPANVPTNYIAFTDSNGDDHWISPDKLAAAKKRDPGLRTY